MGKVRVKLVGDEGQKTKPKQEKKRVAKAPGLKGGERVVSVGPSVEELEKETVPTPQETAPTEKKPKAKFQDAKKKILSAKYKENLSLLKKDTAYPLDQALNLLKKMKMSKFDETIELHINVKEKGTSGQLTLPHGTGKQIRVEIADPDSGLDALVAKIDKGTIDFDVLIATPTAMPKLAKVARVLGPKGLMPNPKAGTITDKPETLVEKLTKGQISFKTETEAPIIHLSVGKASFEQKQLEENINALFSSIGIDKIKSATLKSTMSPGIKLQIVN